MTKLASSGIPIHTNYSGLGNQCPQLLLQLFCTRTKILNITALAFWTHIWHRNCNVTMMAHQTLILVIHKWHSALRTLNNLSAGTTHHKGSKATTVQHNNHLLTLGNGVFNKKSQRVAYNISPSLFKLLSHIYAGHLWKWFIANTIWQLKHGTLANLGPMVCFQ